MWKNKHVVVAMLVAPVLAILAWYGVDYLVAERAEPAQPGSMYPLVARSNCRYDSGECDLVNNDFKVTVHPVELATDRTILRLSSEFELDNATLALVVSGKEVAGSAASRRTPEDKTVWIVNIPAYADPEAMLRVAISAQQSVYFAEVPVVFLRPPG